MPDLQRQIADAIDQAGIRHTFGLMGSSNLRIVHHLAESYGIRTFQSRHESAAIAAADGYARACGRVGLCHVTQGPGLTNALTPLVTASRARSPVVLITGDSSQIPGSESPFSALQGVNQGAVLEALDLEVARLDTSCAVESTIDTIQRAVTDQRTVVLNIPMECDSIAGDEEPRPVAESASRARPEKSAQLPGQEAVAGAMRALESSERPVILAGLGAVRCGAGEALARLAEHHGAMLVTSLRGIGMFDGHPLSGGVSGGFAGDDARALLQGADCVLAFGASLNWFTTERGTLYRNATLVQCDTDPAAFSRYRSADHHLLGDARSTAEALLDLSAALPTSPRWFSPVASTWTVPFDDSTDHEGMDPRSLCRSLDELLPLDRIMVTDAGHFEAFPVEHMRVRDPGSLLYMLEFGAVGGGLGAAVGAAVSSPDRLVVLFIGDGGLLMTLGDLDMAVRERVPLLLVCMNDRAYGSELRLLERAGLPRTHAVFDTPDFAAVARSLGASSTRIATPDDLDLLPEILSDLTGPHVLDCLITRNVVSDVYWRT